MTSAPGLPSSLPRPPSVSPAWRAFMRLSGILALLLFLTPTFYVVKFYAFDQPREQKRAQEISLTHFAPTVPLDAIAPPLLPAAPGNAANDYVPAIQSYASRTRRSSDFDPNPSLRVPTAQEAALFFEGARHAECHFFADDPLQHPRYFFFDPDSGTRNPYRYPVTAQEHYRYLSAAIGLALAMAHVPPPPPDSGTAAQQRVIGCAIIRFGDSLGREQATRTHLAGALIIKRIGLRLLLTHPPPAFQRYADSQQLYAEAVQRKYQLLEPIDPDNIPLQERVARHDADPLWRREAVWALGASLRASSLNFRRPLEALSAKASLAGIAAQDTDPSIRAAAAAVLGEIAQRSAVIRR